MTRERLPAPVTRDAPLPGDGPAPFDAPRALALVAECRRMAVQVSSPDLGWLLALAERALTEVAEPPPPGTPRS